MAKNNSLILLLMIVLIVELTIMGMGLPAGAGTQPQGAPVSEEIDTTPEATPQPETSLEPIEPEPTYPKPTGIPELRKYEINKDDDIWRAQDPSSYITPNNEWVKYYASQLFIDTNGELRYKNEMIVRDVYSNGTPHAWANRRFDNNYISDDLLFNYPANADVWQNADYYLSHEMKGDCEDWSIAITSMMLSGEISVIENGKFVKRIIPAVSVIGYMTNGDKKTRDVWTEYVVYNKTFLTSTGYSGEGYGGFSMTTFVNKNERNNLIPMFEFTNKYFRRI